MEDKEAQEKIKNYAAKWFDKGREYGKVPITKDMLTELEKEGEELLSELGYLKPKGKPPLSDIICPFCGEDDFDLAGLKYHLTHWCDSYQDTEVISRY